MQILGNNTFYLQPAVSSVLDSITQGIVQTTKQDGIDGLDRAMNTFTTQEPNALTFLEKQAPVSAEAEYPDPASFFTNQGGPNEVLNTIKDPNFRPATQLRSVSAFLANLAPSLEVFPQAVSGQQPAETFRNMQTTVTQMNDLQQSLDTQFQQAFLAIPGMFNPKKVNDVPIGVPSTSAQPIFENPALDIKPHRLFVQDGSDVDEVDMNDVDKGRTGDRHCMAMIAAVTKQEPEKIKNMIQENSDGTYTVNFKERISDDPLEYKDRPITVTPDFPEMPPTPSLFNSQDDTVGPLEFKKEIWPLVIEKAYRQMSSDPSTTEIALSGLEAFTGRPVEAHQYPLNIYGRLQDHRTFEQMKSDFDSGKAIVLTSGYQKYVPPGVIMDYYSVSNLHTDESGKQWIEIYNPKSSSKNTIPYEDLNCIGLAIS